MTYIYLVLELSAWVIILSTIIFSWVLLKGLKVLRIRQFFLLLLFAITFCLIGIIQIIMLYIGVGDLAIVLFKVSRILFLVPLICLIIYLDSVWRPQMSLGVTVIIIISFIFKVAYVVISPVEYILVEGSRILVLPFNFLHLIPFIMIFGLLFYEIINTYPVVKDAIKLNMLNLIAIFAVIIAIGTALEYSYPLFKPQDIILAYFQYALSGIILSTTALIMRKKAFRRLAPFVIYGAFISTKTGLNISHRAFVERFKPFIPMASSLLAAVLSLTAGIAEREFSDVFQLYRIERFSLVIYYGKKTVFAVLTKQDSKILREVIRSFTFIFETEAGEIPRTFIDDETIKLGNYILDRFQEMLEGE